MTAPEKHICTRCGNSVGHRGTDTECPPCQYVAELERKLGVAVEALEYISRFKGDSLKSNLAIIDLAKQALAEIRSGDEQKD